ncbi:hypothetical protein [Microbacterium esteraromaticum]|nr:hypothetical protein [Microbacterium esteraromaticum]MBN7792441.1 hypothetical protein [Microbacterium esteraromaticum]
MAVVNRRRNVQHGRRRRPPVSVAMPVVIIIVCIPTLVFLLASLLQAVI